MRVELKYFPVITLKVYYLASEPNVNLAAAIHAC